MKRWSILRTVRARYAARISPRTRSRRWESSGDSTTRCSRCRKRIHYVVTADQPDAPAYFTYDAILNTRERATLEQSLEQSLHPIDLDEVLRWETRVRRFWTCAIPRSMR